jgi:hypothetical protein
MTTTIVPTEYYSEDQPGSTDLNLTNHIFDPEQLITVGKPVHEKRGGVEFVTKSLTLKTTFRPAYFVTDICETSGIDIKTYSTTMAICIAPKASTAKQSALFHVFNTLDSMCGFEDRARKQLLRIINGGCIWINVHLSKDTSIYLMDDVGKAVMGTDGSKVKVILSQIENKRGDVIACIYPSRCVNGSISYMLHECYYRPHVVAPVISLSTGATLHNHINSDVKSIISLPPPPPPQPVTNVVITNRTVNNSSGGGGGSVLGLLGGAMTGLLLTSRPHYR